ncbi:MAG: S8 family serine peptidase [Proteobacteria bacterium]|nr:S8 family serine peptidase [Pseudomonadota bacterium]
MSRAMIGLMVAMLIGWAVPAQAVFTRSVLVTDAKGMPVVNAKVTIFRNGKKDREKKTDDKGIVVVEISDAEKVEIETADGLRQEAKPPDQESLFDGETPKHDAVEISEREPLKDGPLYDKRNYEFIWNERAEKELLKNKQSNIKSESADPNFVKDKLAGRTSGNSVPLAGKLTDQATGAPLDDPQVVLYGNSTPVTPEVQSDGSFNTSLPSGEYTVLAKGKCHQTASHNITSSGTAISDDISIPAKGLDIYIGLSEVEQNWNKARELYFRIKSLAEFPLDKTTGLTYAPWYDDDMERLHPEISPEAVYNEYKRIMEGNSSINWWFEEAGIKNPEVRKCFEEYCKDPKGKDPFIDNAVLNERLRDYLQNRGLEDDVDHIDKFPQPDGSAVFRVFLKPRFPCADELSKSSSLDGPQKTTSEGYAEEDIPRTGQLAIVVVPDDPNFLGRGSWGQEFDDQWAVKRIGYLSLHDEQSAWNLAQQAKTPVIVALVDSGIDSRHPDLVGKIWTNEQEIPDNGVDDDGNGFVDDVHGWNFRQDNNDLRDFNGHGTVDAGLIAATVNNGIGIAGINPLARIMVLKAMDFDLGGGSIANARAIFYAADNRARVINVSIGGRKLSRAEQAAVDYANSKGALVVVAAGNEGIDLRDYSPAGLRGVLTVAATDRNDRRTDFSNWGQQVDLIAPGVDILSLRAWGTDLLHLSRKKEYTPGSAIVGRDGLCYRVSGTSFAAPLVSGTASLILSLRPELTGTQVRNMLLSSTDDIETPGWDQFSGYGMLNASKALQADPAFQALARIAQVVAVEKNGEMVIEVHGTAESSDFQSAWIELGFGDTPVDWKKVGPDLGQAVIDGLAGTVPVGNFASPGIYTVRLVLQTGSHGTRESRAELNIQ